MSSLYLDIYIKPGDDACIKNIYDFIELVEKKDFEKITQLDKEDNLYDVEHYFDSKILCKTINEIINLNFDTFTSFDSESFINFLISLNASEIETLIYDSQCGEYSFYYNDKYLNKYSKRKWKWIANPTVDDDNVLKKLGIRYVKYDCIELVPREEIENCIDKLIFNDMNILGYDTYNYQNKVILPFYEFSKDYAGSKPDKDLIMKNINEHPSEITHYEILFRKS